MIRNMIAVVVISLYILVACSSPVDAACACRPGDASTYCSARWAVIAQIVPSSSSNGADQVTIYVLRVLKGSVGLYMQTLRVPANPNNCKPNLIPGQKYILAGKPTLWLTSCDHIQTFQGSWTEINNYQPPSC